MKEKKGFAFFSFILAQNSNTIRDTDKDMADTDTDIDTEHNGALL
ncbi:hypothetical protein [Desulfosporosinus hippei]|nr:hypothetical protein [Desulfosporosinus hippei]